jgi:hypothetical protein
MGSFICICLEGVATAAVESSSKSPSPILKLDLQCQPQRLMPECKTINANVCP